MRGLLRFTRLTVPRPGPVPVVEIIGAEAGLIGILTGLRAVVALQEIDPEESGRTRVPRRVERGGPRGRWEVWVSTEKDSFARYFGRPG